MTGVLNRESDIPLYKQICTDIVRQINSGELKAGDRISAEIELAEIYSVSRMTVRQALNYMISERILSRRRGFGTFVAEKSVARAFHPSTVTGFFDEFNKNGTVLRSTVVENTLVFPPASICSVMNIDDKTLVCKLVRVRFIDGQPLLVDESYIDKDLWDDIKNHDFSDNSLFAYIAEIVGDKPESADINVTASTASQSIGTHLQIAQGAPILMVVMVNKYKNGSIKHVGKLYCPEHMGLKFVIGNS